MGSPKQVLELARKQGARMVDVKFVDTFGTWQHFTLPFSELNEDSFSDGLGFDGSSIRGWKSIEASDMLAMPDPATAFIDPFMAESTLSLTCTIAETGTKEAYTRDPRGLAQRAEKYLISTGIADTAVFGPEAEFFIFDNVQFDSKSNGTFYSVDSEEAIWNTATKYRINLKYPKDVTMTIAGGHSDIKIGTKWIGTDGWVWVDRSGFDASNSAWKEMKQLEDNQRKVKLYESANHYHNFLDCVKSRNPTITPVETAHHSAIPGHLGLIAMLVGRKIKWDSKKERIIGDEEASKLLTRDYRAPWKLG